MRMQLTESRMWLTTRRTWFLQMVHGGGGGRGEKETSWEGCDEMHNPNTMCGSALDWHHPMILKLNIQKTKIMASSPITSWQIDGETVEIVADFILGA